MLMTDSWIWRMRGYRLLRDFRARLFAAACLGCGTAGADDGAISALCEECAPAVSDRSRQQYARGAGETELTVAYLSEYAGIWRDAILAFKDGRRDVGDVCAALIALRLGPLLSPATRTAAQAGSLILVGVPTTPGRRRERGFDGGEFLALGVGAAWGVPAYSLLSIRRRDHQRGKNRAQRLASQGRFHCSRIPSPAKMHALLIDDVLTTGATLLDASAALQACGITVTEALTLAFVPPRAS